MKRFLTSIIITICVVAGLVMAFVTTLNKYYYKDVFPLGVWINDIYCTGMTVDEVTDLLDNSYDLHSDKISICTIDGILHELPLDEYGVSISYKSAVSECMNHCKKESYGWIFNIANSKKQVVYPTYDYELSAMKAKLEELDWLNKNLYNDKNTVSIIKSTSAGYVLVDETRDLLLKKDAVELICNEIVNQLTDEQKSFTEINLASEDNKDICYKNIPYTSEMKETLSKWNGINDFQSFKLTYVFGDRTEVIDENVVADWMALDNEGNIIFDENNYPTLDETVIEEYITYLSASYDTVGVERDFKSTRGDIVKVPGGSYGNKLDKKVEYEFLLNAFKNKECGTRVPEYISEAMAKGSDDIGNTYIEVDMNTQHMYYYDNGELIIDTPIVTGNMSRRWSTPSKVCYVYFKQKNRVLRGANYATPVKYWMAVDGNIGIHDATWRDEFGGEIYKTNGSHGCINTPLDTMSQLYDMVETGIPVVMFY